MREFTVRKTVLVLALAFLVGVLSSGCQSTPSDELEIPSAVTFGSAVWLDDGWVYFSAYVGDTDLLGEPLGPDTLWRSRPGGGLQKVDVHLPATCRLGRIGVLFRAGRGLGFNAMCGPSDDDALVVMDPATGVSRLFAVVPSVPLAVTMSRDMTRAYAEFELRYGPSQCPRIAMVDHDSVHPLPISVGDGSKKFTISSGIGTDADDETTCDTAGDAEVPRLTADDQHLVFFAAPDAAGVASGVRRQVRGHVYLANLRSGASRVLLDDIYGPSSIDIDPASGQVVVVAGHYGTGEISWADPATGDTGVVAIGHYGAISFCPAGVRFVVDMWSYSDGQTFKLMNLDHGTRRKPRHAAEQHEADATIQSFKGGSTK